MKISYVRYLLLQVYRFFFFKQKTAYEITVRDWSSDVCSSDLVHNEVEGGLGYVGYLTALNLPFIESLWREGLLPVAPCLGIGLDNEIYNINADHMAAACAEFLNADQLIYLTDVAGVLDGEKVISAIACEDVER